MTDSEKQKKHLKERLILITYKKTQRAYANKNTQP